MATIVELATPAFSGESRLKNAVPPSVEMGRSSEGLMRRKRRLRSNSSAQVEMRLVSPQSKDLSPPQRKSPRLSINSTASSQSTARSVTVMEFDENLTTSSSQSKKSSVEFSSKLRWNPRDMEQMRAVKEALHVSTTPPGLVCSEDEHSKVLELCKLYVEQERSGSLYVCGCPGTGKTMVMEKLKHSLADWSKKVGLQEPDVLSMNCTSLTNTSDVFMKALQHIEPQNKISSSIAALKQIQNLYSHDDAKSPNRMMKYSPFSLYVYANRSYVFSCHQVQVLPYQVFQPQALELCARKVAAASGDMRKALCVCRAPSAAVKSQTIKNMIEDNCADNVIPLPNVTSKTLSKVIEYCRKHTDEKEGDVKAQAQLKAWDAEFANIKSLLELTCHTVADMIKGKTPEEIRAMLNIKNDFTPEEEEEIRKENQWTFS